MSATCATHGVTSTGTCERCGTFYCEQCRVERLCLPCSERVPKKGRLAATSVILFGVAIVTMWIPLIRIVVILGYPVGLVLGIVSLVREPENRPLALIGVLLNGAVCAGALFVGFAAGWAA